MRSVGRLVAFAFVAWLAGCAGRSERFDDGEGAGGEPRGGSGGSDAGGAGGTIARGGAAATGGTGATSAGGVATGGGVSTGGIGSSGSPGTGGSSACGECGPGTYGLTVEGDGPMYRMAYNGAIVAGEADAEAPVPGCPEQPLRGSVGGCGRSITLSACEDPRNGPPCLEVVGGAARYIDRQTGALWSGRIVSDVPDPYVPGYASGTLVIELLGDGDAVLVLTVRYAFCTPSVMLDIVC